MTIKGFARVFDDSHGQYFHYSMFVYDTEEAALLAAERNTTPRDRVGYLGIHPVELELADSH